MHMSRHAFTVILICITGAFADFLGPTYPAPVDLSSGDSLIPAAWEKLTSTFDAYFKDHSASGQTAALTGTENVTFSIGMFSIHDPAVEKLQYHWTGPEIANSENGTSKVNGDSIYRIASLTKLFTVFAGMLSLTKEEWDRPVTKINSGLAEVASQGYQSPQWNVQWDSITPWALASQSSGVAREGWPALDTLFNVTSYAALGLPIEDPVTAWGMPPVDISKMGTCWDILATCEGQEFIKAVRSQPPAFLPWTTPMYANDNFMLLGFMISNLTGKPMETIYREAIFEPLRMKSSSSSSPTDDAELARSVIAGPPEAGFAINAPLGTPSGGLFSTTNDLAKFGTAILNSTLLPANTTRKWMKPSMHSASLTYSLGAPWEILRYVHPDTGKVTDFYTKLGDSGFYGANLVLIPDYGAGFSILNAYSDPSKRSAASNIVLDYIVNAILPALEAQAAEEAKRNYVGTYISTDPNLNSSVTIAFNESTVITSRSGLSIKEWISNGTDVLNADLFGGINPRLLPSIPKGTPAGTPGQVAFQASLQPQKNRYFTPGAERLGVIGPFTGQYSTNIDWLVVDATHYGGLGINLFVFEVDEEGRATAVSPAATRVKLERKK